jgi:hypothetical protein
MTKETHIEVNYRPEKSIPIRVSIGNRALEEAGVVALGGNLKAIAKSEKYRQIQFDAIDGLDKFQKQEAA